MKTNEVQFYSRHAKELKYSQRHKSLKFLKHGCIKYEKEKQAFLCLPLEGYNSTTYEMVRSKEFGFECDCQGFQTKLKKFKEGSGIKPTCSHIGALYEYFARSNRKSKVISC